MKLKFCAKDPHLVTQPSYDASGIRMPLVQGQTMRYVNRALDRESRQFRAQPEPFEVEVESPVGRRLVKLARRDGSLWPFDAETAAACGLSFVPVEHNGTGWQPVARKEPGKPASRRQEQTL